MKELGGTGGAPRQSAYSRLSKFRLGSWKIGATDADEKHSSLPKQDTGGSDAFCLRATPVLDRKIHKYT